MNEMVKIELPVDAQAAALLGDAGSRERMGRLVSRIALLHGGGPDPLAAVLERSAARAGMTAQEIEAELDAYNAERRG